MIFTTHDFEALKRRALDANPNLNIEKLEKVIRQEEKREVFLVELELYLNGLKQE